MVKAQNIDSKVLLKINKDGGQEWLKVFGENQDELKIVDQLIVDDQLIIMNQKMYDYKQDTLLEGAQVKKTNPPIYLNFYSLNGEERDQRYLKAIFYPKEFFSINKDELYLISSSSPLEEHKNKRCDNFELQELSKHSELKIGRDDCIFLFKFDMKGNLKWGKLLYQSFKNYQIGYHRANKNLFYNHNKNNRVFIVEHSEQRVYNHPDKYYEVISIKNNDGKRKSRLLNIKNTNIVSHYYKKNKLFLIGNTYHNKIIIDGEELLINKVGVDSTHLRRSGDKIIYSFKLKIRMD